MSSESTPRPRGPAPGPSSGTNFGAVSWRTFGHTVRSPKPSQKFLPPESPTTKLKGTKTFFLPFSGPELGTESGTTNCPKSWNRWGDFFRPRLCFSAPPQCHLPCLQRLHPTALGCRCLLEVPQTAPSNMEGFEGSNYMHPNALLLDVFIDIDFLEHPE